MNKQLATDIGHSSPWMRACVNLMAQIKNFEPLKLIWWCLALCILSGTLARYLTEQTGLIYTALIFLGSGGCAWFWLLSRSLFRDRKAIESKAAMMVPVIVVVEAFEALLPSSSLNGNLSELFRVFGNVASLVCIAAIVFVWHEALSGFNKIRAKHERHFRIIYLGIFSIPVVVAVIWVMGAEEDTFAAEWKNCLMTLCALIALIGSRLAVEYRLYAARDKTTSTVQASSELNDIELTHLLADKILQAINNKSLITQPNLKISDLAAHLGTQEYKVTRCITNNLKYRNFNHMVNQFRIDRALEMLKKPDNDHLNIATIAFECGYNSLGPFNRAFKQHTDTTPSKYRQELRIN